MLRAPTDTLEPEVSVVAGEKEQRTNGSPRSNSPKLANLDAALGKRWKHLYVNPEMFARGETT